MKYNVEHLRAVAFFKQSPDLDLTTLIESVWARVSDVPPESDTSKPREVQRSLSVPLGTGRALEVIANPLRIDLLIGPTMPGSDSMPPLEEEMALFAPKRDAFFSQLTNITRIGVSGGFLRFTSGMTESYKLLGQAIPTFVDAESGVSDLIYRLNRPTVSKLDTGLKINRLCTWSSVQLMSLAAGGGGLTPMGGEFAMKMDVDINSDVARQDPLACDLVALSKELTDILFERLENGDVK
jgi:hypothetical protein